MYYADDLTDVVFRGHLDTSPRLIGVCGLCSVYNGAAAFAVQVHIVVLFFNRFTALYINCVDEGDYLIQVVQR